MKLARPWVATNEDADLLLTELLREVSSHHPLYGQSMSVIARRLDRDDVLVRMPARPERYAIVHLTWRGRAETPPFPTTAFVTLEELTAWNPGAHPTVNLVLHIVGTDDDRRLVQVQALVDELSMSHHWTIHPPALVDEVDEDSRRIIGASLSIYSGYPPEGEPLPLEIDEAQLTEVSVLVARFSALSAQFGCEVTVCFAGEEIGTILGGVPDESIQKGLVGEWRRTLDERRGPRRIE